MAVTTDFAHLTPLQANRYRDIVVNATATVLVDNSATTVYGVEVDNTANTGAISYFKIYLSNAPSPGTTVPIFVFPIPAGTKWFIPLGDQDGYDFTATGSDGVSFACVTEPGTGGTAAPASAVKATVWTD